MRLDFARVRTILLDVPRQGKLAYGLFRDPRVPLAPKLALGAALALIVSPIDFPGWIPVVGDLDMLALGVVSVKVFIEACPGSVVEEHRAALRAGDSRFDGDLGGLVELARMNGGRLLKRINRARAAPPLLALGEKETA